MSREILFRGKRVDGGDWVYGVPLTTTYSEEGEPDESYACIVQGGDHSPSVGWMSPDNQSFVDVIPETVGQYTGLKDKNGNKIFEGDVLRGKFATGYGGRSTRYKDFNYSVMWDGSGWAHHKPSIGNYRFYPVFEGSEIIGNIHDNPELIKP